MFGWLKKWFEKHETVEAVYEKRGVDISGVGQMMAGAQGISLPPVHRARRYGTPVSRKIETASAPPPSNDNLLTGIIIGEMLANSNTPEPSPFTPNDFQGFGGGESGGAGASGSWEPQVEQQSPSCDTSSSSDSSSSCDSSSSSDSGSSGTDF